MSTIRQVTITLNVVFAVTTVTYKNGRDCLVLFMLLIG